MKKTLLFLLFSIFMFAENTITTIGNATLKVKPDIALINGNVQVTSYNLEESVKKGNNIVLKIRKGLEEQNVSSKDVDISNFSMYESYEYEDGKQTDKKTYSVSYPVNIKVRNLDNVSKVIEALQKAEITNIYGVNYNLENNQLYTKDLYEEAYKNAKMKAEVMLDIINIDRSRLKVKTININDGSNNIVTPIALRMKSSSAMGVQDLAPEIEPLDTLDMYGNIEVVFEY